MAIIDKPSDYFETVIYAGGTTDISSLDFQPDWVWAKKRTGAENHGLFDSVRGATKTINSNTTAAESTRSGSLTSFDSDGFTMGGSDGIISASGNNYVAWNWKAGGSASSNTAGSINSSVSVNQEAGFSIVSYTGTGANATVGHGLGSLCKFIIIKRLNSTNDWEIGSTALGWDKHLYFTTGAANTSSNRWQSTAPTNSVFYLGPAAGNNASSSPLIAYCFAEKQGYSKFGSYTGNGNADGTFVYLGFKPAFVMIKSSSNSGQAWVMQDNKRDGFNYNNHRLFADSSAAEESTVRMDLLSNGFKCRDNDGNGNGFNYIYMAFAEEPFVASNFNVATAR